MSGFVCKKSSTAQLSSVSRASLPGRLARLSGAKVVQRPFLRKNELPMQHFSKFRVEWNVAHSKIRTPAENIGETRFSGTTTPSLWLKKKGIFHVKTSHPLKSGCWESWGSPINHHARRELCSAFDARLQPAQAHCVHCMQLEILQSKVGIFDDWILRCRQAIYGCHFQTLRVRQGCGVASAIAVFGYFPQKRISRTLCECALQLRTLNLPRCIAPTRIAFCSKLWDREKNRFFAEKEWDFSDLRIPNVSLVLDRTETWQLRRRFKVRSFLAGKSIFCRRLQFKMARRFSHWVRELAWTIRSWRVFAWLYWDDRQGDRDRRSEPTSGSWYINSNNDCLRFLWDCLSISMDF